MKYSDTIILRYKEMGFKVTPQRLAILNSLHGDKSHPGVHDIYKRLKRDYPTLSLTTVYNTLEILKEMDEVVELTFDKYRVRYDPDTSLHDHIQCIKCKKIEDVPLAEAPSNVTKKRIKGYKILGVSNQFYGLCEDCR